MIGFRAAALVLLLPGAAAQHPEHSFDHGRRVLPYAVDEGTNSTVLGKAGSVGRIWGVEGFFGAAVDSLSAPGVWQELDYTALSASWRPGRRPPELDFLVVTRATTPLTHR